MDTETLPFGNWLWNEVDKRDWSITDFAHRSGMTVASVSRWVNNRRVPDPESCIKIADALRVPLDEVLYRAGHRPLPPAPIDLSDPLTSFAAANQDKLNAAQKRALIDLASQFLEEERNGGR